VSIVYIRFLNPLNRIPAEVNHTKKVLEPLVIKRFGGLRPAFFVMKPDPQDSSVYPLEIMIFAFDGQVKSKLLEYDLQQIKVDFEKSMRSYKGARKMAFRLSVIRGENASITGQI
jgi:hypothetical protein